MGQEPGIGRDDQDRDAGGIGIRVQLLQQLPSRFLPDGDIDNERIRLQRFDLGEGVRSEVGGGDVEALLLEQLTDDVEELNRRVDGEDVRTSHLTVRLHGSFPGECAEPWAAATVTGQPNIRVRATTSLGYSGRGIIARTWGTSKSRTVQQRYAIGWTAAECDHSRSETAMGTGARSQCHHRPRPASSGPEAAR